MKYVLLVSHATLADGMRDALFMLLGPRPFVLSCFLREGMSPDEFGAQVKQETSCITSDDEVVVIADILGGAPLKVALEVLDKMVGERSTIAFGGANLTMAIAAIMGVDDGLDLDAIGDAVLADGFQAVARLR